MWNSLKVLLFFISVSCFATIPESSLNYRGSTFSYYANNDLMKANAFIEHAIITIHGSERNADTYFNSILGIATKLNKVSKTLVISPHFKIPGDQIGESELTWSDEGWLRGNQSLKNAEISSFEIMDNFINLLLDHHNFPNLKNIVITGHSAGGQFTQRYAVGTTTEDKSNSIKIHYVVANPGSYVYLTAKRGNEIPASPECAYNDYKYGLDNLNLYMKRLPIKNLIDQYVSRDVTYLLGELDNVSEGIDQSCEARYQGDTRLHRGQNFKIQLDSEFPMNHHHIAIVPGVSHTQWGMYNSLIGTDVLFNF